MKRQLIFFSIVGALAGVLLVLLLVINKNQVLDDSKPLQEMTENAQKESAPKSSAQKKKEEILEKKPVSIVFTGDVLLSNYVLNNYEAEGIDGVLDSNMQKTLQEADITIINQEFPFSTRGTQAPDKQFTFRVNPSYVKILQEMGVDMVTLANNHVLDYGVDAMLDTMDTLDEAEILHAGAGDAERAKELQIIETKGKKIGMLAASRVIPVASWNIDVSEPGLFCTYDPTALVEEIKKAKDACDYLIVYVHWGVERSTYPEEYQKNMAHMYIDAGADAVIGSHPHVLQGIEFYENKPIFYSLGNFIFNQSIPSTMAVRFEVLPGEEPKIQIVPATATDATTVSLTKDETRQAYDMLEGISEGIEIDEDGYLLKK